MLDKLVLFLLIFLASCSDSKKIDYTNVIINTPGLYWVGENKLEIKIIDNLVKYSLLNTKGDILVKPKHNISNHQKWMVLWDGERLWFDSSDIGGEVWVIDTNGTYTNISFNNLGSLSKRMPKKMYQRIVKYVERYPHLYNWKPE